MNIVLTGAGKGIGYATTLKLAASGKHKIVAVSRDISTFLESPVEGVIPIAVDLANTDSLKSFADFVGAQLNTVDVLINNAGLLINRPFDQQSPADFDQQFNVNVKSPFFLIQELMPYFASSAHIVNISSMGGFQGSNKYPGLSLYSASKAALIVLTECLAVELRKHCITINCLALGAVQTEMLNAAFPGYKAEMTATEMAEFIANFAQNGSKYFNGKILPVTLTNP